MKILFLSRWFPYPANNGSKLRIYNLLRSLSSRHELTLLSFADQADADPHTPEIQALCTEVQVLPWREFDPVGWRARLGFFSLKPRSIIDTFSPKMAARITQLLARQRFDLIIASQLQMAAYSPYFGNVPAVFEELEIGLHLGAAQPAASWKRKLRQAVTWFKLHHYLARLLGTFRAVTVASEQEKALVQRSLPAVKEILVVPNCIRLEDYRGVRTESQPNTLIFTGSFRYHTNHEAMVWFVGQVFPRVLEQVPTAQLIITGDHAGLPLPSGTNVTLAGHVADIKALIAASTVALAPLWSGGGTRLKILEAMALGTPVVATSKGAEGLEAESGQHLLITDDPDQFADAVVRLLADTGLRHQLSAQARRLVSEKYDWEGVMPGVQELLERSVRP